MFLGVIVNVLAVVAGSAVGLFFKDKLHERYQKALTNVIALGVVGVGVTYAIKTQNLLVMILSLIIGTLLGTWIRIDDRLERLGDRMQSRLKQAGSTFAEGFAGASILYCVGSMAIMGCMNSALNGDHAILFTKSVMDGVTSIFLASALGVGVMFSAVAVLVYQGLLTLGFSLFAGSLDSAVVSEISAVGGIILFGIAINMLQLKKVKTGDMALALFVPIGLVPLLNLLGL
jgi:uncharacterized membrane protein YqgA involved in biofilm formation